VHAAAVEEGDAVVQVFRVRDGTVVSRDHFSLEGSEGALAPDVLASFLRQHYAVAAAVPPEIVVPVPIPEVEAFETFATERRGGPAKHAYRRFRAKIVDRNDDFANMRETLRRRFQRSAADGEGWPLPDLVILDGGKGQLSAGQAALSDAGLLQIPIAALAKEREELFVPARPDPIVLPRTSQGLYLVQRVRDEAHRFAVTYHQNVRAKRAVRSVLDDVDG